MLSSLFDMAWKFGLVYGAANMIQSHAYVCNTMFCIYLVLISYCMGAEPFRAEIIGVFLTLGGIAIMLSDT